MVWYLGKHMDKLPLSNIIPTLHDIEMMIF
jgi:hypothetical protein